MPSVIVDVMRSVLLSCNSIAKEPPPIVALKGLDATALDRENGQIAEVQWTSDRDGPLGYEMDVAETLECLGCHTTPTGQFR